MEAPKENLFVFQSLDQYLRYSQVERGPGWVGRAIDESHRAALGVIEDFTQRTRPFVLFLRNFDLEVHRQND